jgi:hypothetical protein
VAARTERGCLLIADISGYTEYVVASPLEYAEDVVADLTRDVVERLEPIVRVNKLEGDAAFGYALDGEVDGSMLLDSTRSRSATSGSGGGSAGSSTRPPARATRAPRHGTSI